MEYQAFIVCIGFLQANKIKMMVLMEHYDSNVVIWHSHRK